MNAHARIYREAQAAEAAVNATDPNDKPAMEAAVARYKKALADLATIPPIKIAAYRAADREAGCPS